MNKNPYHIKGTSDHWWSIGMQKLWVDEKGHVSRIRYDGSVERKKPNRKKPRKSFAWNFRGHEISFGISPWNHSFEDSFAIDNVAPEIAQCLLSRVDCVSFPWARVWKTVLFQRRKVAQLNYRTQPLSLPLHEVEVLSRWAFSVLIRSPAFRYRMAQAGCRFGFEPDLETGKANILHFWSLVKDFQIDHCNPLNLAVLRANKAEFVFGDGLFDQLTGSIGRFFRSSNDPSQWRADLRGQCVVPVSPRIALFISFGQRARVGASQVLIDLIEPEVTQINELTQIYSKDELFFRNQKPVLVDAFKQNEHLAVTTLSGHLLERKNTVASE